MGMVILGAFFVALIGALIPGIGGLLLFLWLYNQKNRGTWLRYIVLTCVGGLAMVGIGVLQVPPESPGAPTEYDYAGMITAAFLIGLAPGAGLLTGCLAALTKREGEFSDPS